MTKKKEAAESPLENEFSIKIIDSEILKNKKLYLKLSEEVTRLPPPVNSPHLWFDFGKQWHPIGLFDSSGKLVISKNAIQMEISNQPSTRDNSKPTPFVVSAMATKGVYWFSVASAYVGGAFTFKFTSPGTNSLIHRCVINDGSMPESTRAKDSSVDPTLAKPTPMKSKPKKETLIKEVEDPKETDNGESKSKRIKTSNTTEAIPANEPKIRLVKAAGSGRSRGIGGSSSPVPGGGPRLSHKSRLDRSTATSVLSSSLETSIKLSPPQIVKVKGPILEISLPMSLTVALLDDRARVDSGAAALTRSNKTADLCTELKSTISLSVTDLLNKVQQRAKHSIADCDVLILRVRQLFECLFETSILYSAERTAMKQQLAQMRTDKLNYADCCGGIYLLRLLVLIVTGADSIYPPVSEASAGVEDLGPSDSLDLSERAASSSSESALSDTALCAVGVSSQTNILLCSKSRRSAIIERHHKMEFHKLQEVIDCALKELDESAHIIF